MIDFKLTAVVSLKEICKALGYDSTAYLKRKLSKCNIKPINNNYLWGEIIENWRALSGSDECENESESD